MGTYLYELPTTGAISFADFCLDERALYTAYIAEATQARANLRGALKESKRDHGEKDYLKLIKILDEYLPLLYGIYGCVVEGELGLRMHPEFSWRTTLSANLFNTSPRLSLPTLFADSAYSLLTYAFALSNLARSSVASLGAYERERGISDIERKAKDEKLNFAVTMLCRASGLFFHISEKILVDWDRSIAQSTAPDTGRPPDLSREVNAALAKLALADAQSLAIRKLLSKSAYDSTVTPGPPLPASHPSPALVAKLHLECASLYSSARALAKTPSSSKSRGKHKESSSGADGEVSSDLRRYLQDESAFHGALARKWLGVDAGENGGTPKAGEAIAFLAWAKKELEEVKDSGRSFGVGKERLRKDKVTEELEIVNVFLKHYKKVNNSLSFQLVPSQSELQSCIPTGRLAITVKPFVPPIPAFGPGSIEYIRRQADQLDLDGEDNAGENCSARSTARFDGTYAGAGSYF